MVPVFITFVAAFVVAYGGIWFDGSAASTPVRLVAAVLFGWSEVMPLLHIMHDASHAAIGHTEAWWRVIGRLTLDWMAGACMMAWHHQHVVGAERDPVWGGAAIAC